MGSCSEDALPVEKEPDNPPVIEEEEENNNEGDPKLLYNGIRLPGRWPPIRSYTSDLENGMNPFYLTDKPETINIEIIYIYPQEAYLENSPEIDINTKIKTKVNYYSKNEIKTISLRSIAT